MGATHPKALSIGQRQRRLAESRERKMARSPMHFVRGTPRQFYDWLASAEGRALPEGPPIWICGDCHFGNLGPVAGKGGNVGIAMRDFDQSVIGNPAHDIIRLALSLSTVARGSDLSGLTIVGTLENIARGYRVALAEPGSGVRNLSMPGAVKKAMHKAVGRKWRQLSRQDIDGAKAAIPRDKRFWDPLTAERKGIEALFDTEAVRTMVTSLHGRDDDASVDVLDAAYWIKGCSSLGKLRFAVLVEVGGKEPDSLRRALIDIKQAQSAAAPAANAIMPASPAERVLEGARHLAPGIGKRMAAGHIERRPVFLRELMPQDLKLEVGGLDQEDARALGSYLGFVVGAAHASQMCDDDRREWRQTLARDQAKPAETPRWLWSGVVALLATYDGAYLDHCRKLAGR